MSKVTPDCVICHHNPAYDASGWCRKCDDAYNAQQEPEEEMPELSPVQRPLPAQAPSFMQGLAWAVTRPSAFPAPAPEEPPYRFPF
jgi:hypothetical protein